MTVQELVKENERLFHQCLHMQDMLRKAYVILREKNDLDKPENVLDVRKPNSVQTIGVCPACKAETTIMESRYRCRYCGKELLWKI